MKLRIGTLFNENSDKCILHTSHQSKAPKHSWQQDRTIAYSWTQTHTYTHRNASTKKQKRRNGVFNFFIWRIIPQGKRSNPGSQKTTWLMTRFWSFCMTPTYVMLNPQCGLTGNTIMIA